MPSTKARPRRKRPGVFAAIRSNFLAGLIVIAPLLLTGWLIWGIVGWVDGLVLPFVPQRFRPDQYIGSDVRGVGLVFFLIVTVLVGWIAKGFIGRTLIRSAERLVDRMPIVRSVYGGIKQIAETIFAQSETSFDKACLVEYPSKGLWAIAFISSTAKHEIAERMPGEGEKLSVFLPTTPNPTSGYLLFVCRESVIELDMTIEDAAKLIISAGLVYPEPKRVPLAATRAVAAPRAAAKVGPAATPPRPA